MFMLFNNENMQLGTDHLPCSTVHLIRVYIHKYVHAPITEQVDIAQIPTPRETLLLLQEVKKILP